MSLKDSRPCQVPEYTARVAKAIFQTGHRSLTLRDTFGDVFDSDDFRFLFHAEGRPATSPACLALVTLVQFAERLSDERAADAVRARIDRGYLLALPLDHPGFDASVLSEFRTRLVEGHAEHLLFERLLERFRGQRLLRVRGQQRTDFRPRPDGCPRPQPHQSGRRNATACFECACRRRAQLARAARSSGLGTEVHPSG